MQNQCRVLTFSFDPGRNRVRLAHLLDQCLVHERLRNVRIRAGRDAALPLGNHRPGRYQKHWYVGSRRFVLQRPTQL